MRLATKFTFLVFTLFSCLSAFGFKDTRLFAKGDVVYVHSLSGLSLRKQATTKSGRQAIMPYGARLTIAARPNQEKTLVIENIRGYWVEVDYNGVKGYCFTGFISRFPAPKSKLMSAYISQLEKSGFTDARYAAKTTPRSETSGPGSEATLTLKNANILDGFLIARKLFSIPDSLKLPEYQLNLKMTIADPEKPADLLSRKLTVEIHKDGKPQAITLRNRKQTSGSTRTIKVTGENALTLSIVDYAD